MHNKSIGEVYQNIPTWDNGVWTNTTFQSREEFALFLETDYFKEPGEYNLDNVVLEWQKESIKFKNQGFYCDFLEGSSDFIKYWDTEKYKCRKGVLFIKDKRKYYLSRQYYMWINFMMIHDKVKKTSAFPMIWDSQYHMQLYEVIAELKYLHGIILKKRQFGSSLFHAARLINQIWFEDSPVLKIGSSLSTYVTGQNGTWKFLQAYRDFLNDHTAWYRPMNPGGIGGWQQKIEATIGGRLTQRGRKGVLTAHSFQQSDTEGVGGSCAEFFYEEAGIAPRMDKTYEFMRPALEAGEIVTGFFVGAGTVGDLSQCGPLKHYIYNAAKNGFCEVTNKWVDSKGTVAKTGLFIPEQWSMPPYIDEFGNSKVEEALKALIALKIQWKKDLDPETYQIRCSQRPSNMEEAFDFRGESIFPLELIKGNERAIDEGDYPCNYYKLAFDINGNVVANITNKTPISTFPIEKGAPDKTGVLVVYEPPDENIKFCSSYFASVDPVGEGKAESVDNLVYTPTGRKRIGDVKINDYVIGSNGKKVKVLGVYPQGDKELYRVHFNDGFSLLVCKEHLWSVSSNGGEKINNHVLSTDKMMDKNGIVLFNGVNSNSNKVYKTSAYYKNSKACNKWKIPITKPIVFEKIQDLSIPPYLLGLLLGDGGMSQRRISFSSIDLELVDALANELTDDLQITKSKGVNCDYSIKTRSGTRNSLSQKLRNLNLKGCRSEHKFIPDAYKYTAIKNRLALLQGLLDTDGSCTNHGVEFYSSSKQLATDVVELIQSLGGIAKIRCKKTTHLDSYIVRVLLPIEFSPFRLKRKLNKYKFSQVFSRYICNITYEKIGAAVCISVDSPDSLYVTEHAIVTHNTVTSDSLCSIYVYKNPVVIRDHQKDGTVKTRIDGDKVVACWTGRYDDINKTHEQLEMIIQWYLAWTIIENNIPLFIQHMQHVKKQKFLVPSSQFVFGKDVQGSRTQFQQYGWRNVSTVFKTVMLSYFIEFLKEVIDEEVDAFGDVVKSIYGITRIPDKMVHKEMLAYENGANVDRLVALAALITFVKIQETYRRVLEKDEHNDERDLDKSEKFRKLSVSPFKNIGSTNAQFSMKNQRPRSPFKNFK